MLFVYRMTTVAQLKIVKTEFVRIHARMATHVIRAPNALFKIIVRFALVRQGLQVIRLSVASRSVLNQDHNVRQTTSAHHQRRASIKLVGILVSNVIHAVRMRNAVQFNIIQRVTVLRDGPVIHNVNATNVSVL